MVLLTMRAVHPVRLTNEVQRKATDSDSQTRFPALRNATQATQGRKHVSQAEK